MKKRSQIFGTILLLAGLVVFGVFPLCSYQVRVTEAAVLETFGKYRTITEPGLKTKLPWPIQKVHKLDTTVQILEYQSFDSTYLADDKALELKLFATWRIDDPGRFWETVSTRDRAERTIRDMLGTEKAVVLAQHPISHLVSTNPEELRFADIEQEILTRIQQMALSKYGIRVESVGIEQMLLPPSMTQPVFDRMASERRNKASRIRQEGELEAGRIIAQAELESNRIRDDAKAKAASIRSDGDEEAAKLYEQIQGEEGKEFAIFLRQLDALEEIMSQKTYLVIDREVPPFTLLKGEMIRSRDLETDAPAQP